jgi:hypothetical protein
VPEMAEVTALGCALAAGLGVGEIEDEAALKQLHREHKTYQIYDSSVGSHPKSNAQAISFADFWAGFPTFECADQRKGEEPAFRSVGGCPQANPQLGWAWFD